MAYTQYYVDLENGNDSNDGSDASPFLTLQKAFDSFGADGGMMVFITGTANGLTAVFQCQSASGVFAITVEDSPDDSAWSTLETFTLDGSAIGSEVSFVTGTIERYVRVTATRTSGTIQLAVGYARN